MALYYIINTHVEYTEPLSRLLTSMSAAGIEDNIILAIAGYSDEIFAKSAKNFYTIAATHNSFDYTGAIELIKHFDHIDIDYTDHVFFLQDTMEFNKDTPELIWKFDPEDSCTAVFGGQCNLMRCRVDYLMKDKRTFIENMRNCSKQDSIIFEGALWKTCYKHHRGVYSNSDCLVLGQGHPYSGAPRIKELYTGINLIKWKANYGQTGPHNWVLQP